MKNSFSLMLLPLLLSLISLNLNASAEDESRYPMRMMDRPGIVPAGIINVDIDGTLKDLSAVDVGISGTFGIVKGLQGSFAYDGLQMNPFEARSSFLLGAKYQYLALPGFSAYINAKLPINIFGHIIREFSVGLPVTFYTDRLAFGGLSDLFTVQMRDNVAGMIKFKAWFGIQVVGNLYAELNTSLGQIELKNPDNDARVIAKGLWQVLPLEVSLLYALSPHFDIQAKAGYGDIINLKNLSLGLTLTIRGGRLFG